MRIEADSEVPVRIRLNSSDCIKKDWKFVKLTKKYKNDMLSCWK